MGNGITTTGRTAFTNCTSLTTVNFSNVLERISLQAFRNCSALQTVDLPNSLVYMEPAAFSGCGIQSITIPDNVEQIMDYQFYSCSALQSVQLSSSLVLLGTGCFRHCNLLTTVYMTSQVASNLDVTFGQNTSFKDSPNPVNIVQI
tara:strand:- start:1154 stop:1591 length:438 start_codon:yes stop_codon:yes gene_type:complete